MEIISAPVLVDAMTPREIVRALDAYVIGQDDAKRAVAVAIRNRWRRQQLSADDAREVTPKNIIMIGPTGVGKTEVARRIAAMIDAPFIKVEASKYTEVGYQGRDVESMIRDLVKVSHAQVRAQERERVLEAARGAAEERVLDLLLPAAPVTGSTPEERTAEEERHTRTREKLRDRLRKGDLDERMVELPVRQAAPVAGVMGAFGNDEMTMEMQDFFEKMLPAKHKPRRVTVRDAMQLVLGEEADKLVDDESLNRRAIERAEQGGIIFLDEIDKIIGSDRANGPDISREGVQRDLLPIVEGSTVNTKFGMVKTDHILFIAAGAFHGKKPSDLIPELQGRFPIRVTLQPLTRGDFRRILTHPKNALTHQVEKLLAAEGVTVRFEDAALDAMAEMAETVNRRTDDIGARRLHTIMEKLMEEVSFSAPERKGETVTVTDAMVRDRLKDLIGNEDLSRYVL